MSSPTRALVTEICERLDRLPLALELVAARTAELMPDELLASLERRLELASRGARDLPERQRTLRAAIGWSHGLLDPVGRRLLVRLGVFAGGFTREAVAAVCGDDAGAIGSLVEGNLVRRADDGRYRMLQVIREYALEHLAVDDEESVVRRRHAEHYAAMGEELVAVLPGAGVDEAYATFEREHDNFRAALAFTGSPDLVELRLRLAAAVSHFWLVRGHLAEGRSWLYETLRLAQGTTSAGLHAGLLRKLATLEWRQGDFDPAGRARGDGARAAGGRGRRERALAPAHPARLHRVQPARERRRRGVVAAERRARAVARERRPPLALARERRGRRSSSVTTTRAQREIYDESVEAARRADHREYLANALMGLGDARIRLGDRDEGRSRLLESLDLYTKLGFHDRVASNCVWLAPAFEQEEDYPTAGGLLGAASGIRKRTGASLDWQEQEYRDALIERLRAGSRRRRVRGRLRRRGSGAGRGRSGKSSAAVAPAPAEERPRGLVAAGVLGGRRVRWARAARLAKQIAVARATWARIFVRSISDLLFGDMPRRADRRAQVALKPRCGSRGALEGRRVL